MTNAAVLRSVSILRNAMPRCFLVGLGSTVVEVVSVYGWLFGWLPRPTGFNPEWEVFETGMAVALGAGVAVVIGVWPPGQRAWRERIRPKVALRAGLFRVTYVLVAIAGMWQIGIGLAGLLVLAGGV